MFRQSGDCFNNVFGVNRFFLNTFDKQQSFAVAAAANADIGAVRVRELYGVEDPAISQAIARHTVGGPEMTVLDKIIWYADMIEPGRDFPGVDELRELGRTASLDAMLLAGLSHSIVFVVEKGHLIHPATVLARNEILLNQMKARQAEAKKED